MDPQSHRDHVSKYYGETLKSSADLRTSACCPVGAVPTRHQEILSQLHHEVTARFYGCGSPIPHYLQGTTVLDLGCGSGRDAFLASALVGRTGSVIGIDMTDRQLDIPRSLSAYHAKAFFNDPDVSNVDFRKAIIEDLSQANISDNSVDVVISNCVCNLSPQKSKVFSEVFRVLKQGGEFYFSDVYADRRLTLEAARNPILIGECLGGALYLEDFRRIMANVGFSDVRVVSSAPVELMDSTLTHLVRDVQFFSVTFRAFKISEMEDRREDYAQTATYTLPTDADETIFKLDVDNYFKPDTPTPVDANTAAILSTSRFNKMFTVTQRQPHKGLFKRAKNAATLHSSFDCFRPVPSFLKTAKKTSSSSCPPSSETEKATETPTTPKRSSNGCCPTSEIIEEVDRSCASTKTPQQLNNGCCPTSKPSKKNPSSCQEAPCGPKSNC